MSRTRHSRSCLLLLVGLASAATPIGCAPLNIAKHLPWPGRDSESEIPGKMTVVWTDTSLNQPGRPAVRGFGGRIMFYGKDEKKPVKVNGRLTVYAFDESETPDANAAPKKKYVFNADQLPQHYSESKLGHSYSVWLPWDEIGGPTRKIGLIVRFEPTDGPAIASDNSHQLLPGIGGGPESTARVARLNLAKQYGEFHQEAPAGDKVTQISHAEIDPRSLDPRDRPASKAASSPMETLTIEVPDDFAQHHFSGTDAAAQIDVGNAAREIETGTVATARRPTTGAPLRQFPAMNGDGRGPDDRLPQRGATREAEATRWEAEAQDGRSTRFARRLPPVRTASGLRPPHDHLRKQPYRATWPSPLPETPRYSQSDPSRILPADEASASGQWRQDRAE